MTSRPLYFKQLQLGPMQNFVYLLGDPASREAAVVDPGWGVPSILEQLKQDGYRLVRVFVTHTHFDHVQGLQELLTRVDVPVHVHRSEAAALALEPPTLKPVGHGEVIRVGNVGVTLLHTPGHSPGSQCLLVDDRLLSGDTLFIGGCGRCDLLGGDPKALYTSLVDRLKTLKDTTPLFPGHDYAEVPSSTVGQEKQTNPFLRVGTLQEFLRLLGLGG